MINVRALVLVFACLTLAGCNSEPSLHSLTGKVTLDGRSYERLIVYFRPIGQKVNKFNLGVGETDADGNLKLRSTAGMGLAAGKYRVSFSCIAQNDRIIGMSDEKTDDDRNVVTRELVPPKYVDGEKSPVEFEVLANKENVFEFDIPGE